MDLTLLEKFIVGNVVVVADNSPASIIMGLRTYGLAGCVKKIDYKAGVCVQLFVSRAFEPCFWYQPASLAIQTKMEGFIPLSADQILARIGPAPGKNSVITGCLRSWLIAKANARPGQSLFQFISKMTWEELDTVYTINGGAEGWLKVNDTRVRRPQLTETVTDVTVFDQMKGALSAKRPKIGG